MVIYFYAYNAGPFFSHESACGLTEGAWKEKNRKKKKICIWDNRTNCLLGDFVLQNGMFPIYGIYRHLEFAPKICWDRERWNLFYKLGGKKKCVGESIHL